jgi:hypothetical protein
MQLVSFMEQVDLEDITDRRSSSAFTKQCHLLWVSTELGNIPLHPGESSSLIQKSKITLQ